MSLYGVPFGTYGPPEPDYYYEEDDMKRCEATVIINGTPTVCDWPLDRLGQCPRAGDHRED